eukprot:3167216-Rhodomonas_salina.1
MVREGEGNSGPGGGQRAGIAGGGQNAQSMPRLPQMIKLMSARQVQTHSTQSHSDAKPAQPLSGAEEQVLKGLGLEAAKQKRSQSPATSPNSATRTANVAVSNLPAGSVSVKQSKSPVSEDEVNSQQTASKLSLYVSPWRDSGGNATKRASDGLLANDDGVTIKADV